VLGLVREHQGERVLCTFNLSDQAAELALPEGCEVAAVLDDSGVGGATLHAGQIEFAPWGVLIARLG
jgi:alpha-glucosidase